MPSEAPTFVASKDDCRIAVYEAGNEQGFECVFIHGFALDHSVWRYQFTSPELLTRCRIIAVDLRGHGRSGRPDSAEAYRDSETWAADLDAVIRQKRIRRPVIVAWSFGGRVVLDYIRHYGQSRLAGIHFVAAASISDPDVVLPAHTLLHAVSLEQGSEKEKRAVQREYLENALNLDSGNGQFQHFLEVVDAVPARIKRAVRGRPLGYDDLLPGIEVPVLASHGSKDPLLDPEMSVRLAAMVKNGTASVYENAGHAPFFEEPDRFNRELLEFVKLCNHDRQAG